jgi:plasmid stabilization system protein ParE
MRLVFAEPAARDLDDIIDYIALDNRDAAEKVYRALAATAERLIDFPEIGRSGRLPGTREFAVPFGLAIDFTSMFQSRYCTGNTRAHADYSPCSGRHL